MNNLGDYLDKKAQKLDLGRADSLLQIQTMLDAWYPGRAKAQKIVNGKLTIITTSSSVANELRFKTNILISNADIKSIVIKIAY